MTAIFARDFDRESEQEARIHGGRLTEADLEEIRQAAFAEGERKGRIEAEARMRDAAETRRVRTLDQLREKIATLLSEREAHERALETHLLDYVIAIGERVMPDLIASRAPHQVMGQIRRGLRMGLGSGHVRVRLSAEDHALIGPDLEALIAGPEHLGRVEVSVDEEARAGDVSVEWDRGALDFSLAAICDEILELLRKSHPDAADRRAGTTMTRRGSPR